MSSILTCQTGGLAIQMQQNRSYVKSCYRPDKRYLMQTGIETLYISVVPIVASYRKLVAVAKNRQQSIETFHYRLLELRYGSKFFRNIWFICSWLGLSKRSYSILHLFSTYFKINSYKIEAKNALNLAKSHDFSRDGRSHIVVDSRNLIGQFRLRNIG